MKPTFFKFEPVFALCPSTFRISTPTWTPEPDVRENTVSARSAGKGRKRGVWGHENRSKLGRNHALKIRVVYVQLCLISRGVPFGIRRNDPSGGPANRFLIVGCSEPCNRDFRSGKMTATDADPGSETHLSGEFVPTPGQVGQIKST